MLKSILDALSGRGERPADPDPKPAGDAAPAAGELYGFRTTPYTTVGPPETGRYAALKVLGVRDKLFIVAVLDGVWPALPSLAQARRAAVLKEHRFAYQGGPAVFGVHVDGWKPSDMQDFHLLGADSLTGAERKLAADLSRYAILSHAGLNAEGEWRWKHDRAALEAEVQAEDAAEKTRQAAREDRYRTRLSVLTWDQLLAETPFENWTPSPPYPPEAFTLAARQTIHDACRALSALGPKPRKTEVRAVLRACVEWFNTADESAGGVIETEEREDICAVLEEMAHVARQKGLVEEIEVWRDW